jgi:hypothetical protein
MLFWINGNKCDGAHTQLFFFQSIGMEGYVEGYVALDFYSEMDIFMKGIKYSSDETPVLVPPPQNRFSSLPSS